MQSSCARKVGSALHGSGVAGAANSRCMHAHRHVALLRRTPYGLQLQHVGHKPAQACMHLHILSVCSIFALRSCSTFPSTDSHLWCCTTSACTPYHQAILQDLGFVHLGLLEPLTCVDTSSGNKTTKTGNDTSKVVAPIVASAAALLVLMAVAIIVVLACWRRSLQRYAHIRISGPKQSTHTHGTRTQPMYDRWKPQQIAAPAGATSTTSSAGTATVADQELLGVASSTELHQFSSVANLMTSSAAPAVSPELSSWRRRRSAPITTLRIAPPGEGSTQAVSAGLAEFSLPATLQQPDGSSQLVTALLNMAAAKPACEFAGEFILSSDYVQGGQVCALDAGRICQAYKTLHVTVCYNSPLANRLPIS